VASRVGGALARALDRAWPPAPAERLAAVRILVGLFAQVYFTIRLPHLHGFTELSHRQFEPIGLLWLLERPPPAALVVVGAAATWLSGLGFLAGWRFHVTGPLHALLLLAALTYCNSWGQIFHTENLMVLYVLVLAASRAADATSLDARRRGAVPGPHGRYGWPLALMCVLMVTTYFMAGVAKLRWAGSGWIGGEVLRNTVAADSLRKIVLGSTYSPIAELFLEEAWLFRGLAIFTLVVELGAPLALLGRRIALVWIGAVLGFHLGVVALMWILFQFPVSGVAFAPFLRPERLVEWVRRRAFRSSRAAPPAAARATDSARLRRTP
jgi:hypothetical protein